MKSTIYLMVCTLLCFGLLNTAIAQDVRTTLFKEANAALEEARNVKANILSPKSFDEGMKYYREAEEDLKKGNNLQDIQKKLRASVAYFTKAGEATKLAEVTLVSSIKARSDAQKVRALENAKEPWLDAEDKFRQAATKLEDGNVNEARKRSAEAEKLYRKSELEAIKVLYLNDTWQYLEQAEKQDVKKYAPMTLAKSQKLIKDAEKELNTNRYDTDVARDLARQAKYEARHALYLAKIVKQLRDDKDGIEAFLLNTEQPLNRIAATLDFPGEFDTGYDKTADKIVSLVKAYQDSVSGMTQNLAERDQDIELLTARMAEMQEKLGGIEKEKSALAQRMAVQAKIREQFSAVEQTFTRDEAQVLREGNDIIVRLVGLNFAVGKSTIEPGYFSLLTKVQRAIRTFPESSLTIEGHTDSYGSDEANLRLSRERAEAVRQYLIANMSLTENQITSVGFGEGKPIANNETPEGRTKNRRIDVIIHPQIPGTY